MNPSRNKLVDTEAQDMEDAWRVNVGPVYNSVAMAGVLDTETIAGIGSIDPIQGRASTL